MLQTAQKMGVSPRTLSFTAAVQFVAASWLVILLADEALAKRLVDAAAVSLAEHVVNDRPGRQEPRAIKRQPKPHKLLTKPRDQARAKLIGKKRP